MRRYGKGFTLIELMIAVGIIAILAAVVLPQYRMYTERTHRTEAMADLMECAQGMERMASQTFTYEGGAVGGADAGVVDASVCTPVSTSANVNRYVITVNGTPTAFTLLATPVGNVDQGRIITYDSAGQRGWDEDGVGGITAAEMDWEEG